MLIKKQTSHPKGIVKKRACEGKLHAGKSLILHSIIALTMLNQTSSAAELVGIDVWPPDTLEDRSGIADKKAECIFNKAGIDVTYKKYPWARIYDMVTYGELQLSYGWVITEKRMHDITFSEPMLQSREYLVYLKDNPISWGDIKDLEKYRIGGLIGYSHLDIMDENGITPSTKVKSEGQLMEMLFAKRIDAFPIREQVLNEMRRTLPTEKPNLLETGEKPFSESSLHIISPKNKTGVELIDKINAAINSSVCN